jgi:hypothetical protein
MRLGWGNNEGMQNFVGETYWKTSHGKPRTRWITLGWILRGSEADGTGSGSYLLVGFGISAVEPSGSVTTVLVRWILGR